MLILAIDTTTAQAGLALLEQETIRAEWSWTAAGNHSQHLDRLLRSLFETERVGASDLGAVVVATGPGSFSGLRVGVSFAKGLALASGIPLIGISTLDILGLAGLFLSGEVLATIPAGRQQLYVGSYQGDAERLIRTRDYAILLPSEVAAWAGPQTLLCGPGAAEVVIEIERQGWSARQEPSVWRIRRAGFLAELGRRRLAEGGVDDLHTLEPLYLRRSAAEEQRMARQE